MQMNAENKNVSKPRFKKRWFFFIFLIAFILWAKDYAVPSSWNYKLTVTLDTPDGEITESVVHRMEARLTIAILPESQSVKYDVYGEAVTFKLGNDEHLFVIMPQNPYFKFQEAFQTPNGTFSGRGNLKFYKNLKTGDVRHISNNMFQIVFFNDVKDPMSARRADNRQIKVLKASIEITDAAVTDQITNILPWLEQFGGGYLHGGFTSRGAPLGLSGLRFKRN